MGSNKPLADEIAELDAAAEDGLRPVDARRKAMDYLARREHTAGELVDKLTRAGFDRDIVIMEVERLADEGLQSDERFAEAFIASRVRQGKGPLRIRADLAGKRVPEALVDAAFAEFDGDWRSLACEVREKKFGADRPGDFKARARQMRFLQYRGFDSEQIRAACGDAD
jgi:regulatory protein